MSREVTSCCATGCTKTEQSVAQFLYLIEGLCPFPTQFSSANGWHLYKSWAMVICLTGVYLLVSMGLGGLEAWLAGRWATGRTWLEMNFYHPTKLSFHWWWGRDWKLFPYRKRWWAVRAEVVISYYYSVYLPGQILAFFLFVGWFFLIENQKNTSPNNKEKNLLGIWFVLASEKNYLIQCNFPSCPGIASSHCCRGIFHRFVLRPCYCQSHLGRRAASEQHE